MIHRISSRSNPQVKNLLQKKECFLFFEGEKLVMDILGKGIAVEILIILDSREHQIHLPSQRQVTDTWFVGASVMDKLTGLKDKPALIAVLKPKNEKINFSASQVVIALDNLQDPGNGGTIFRCAAAFGIDAVAFCGASVQPTNPKFLRAAQNAYLHVPFQHFETVELLLTQALAAGMHIYLTASHSPGVTLQPEDILLPCLIVFGNEGQGLAEDFLLRFPAISIAQTDTVESLNVGVSACIIMHELQKRIPPK